MADGFGGENQFGQHNNDVFFGAMQNLASNIKKDRISSSVEDANARVQQIKQQMQPGADQRAALGDAARDVFMNMTALGADPNAAAMVYQNLVPKTYSTIDQAILSGDPYEKTAAMQIQDEQANKQAMRDQQKFQYQSQITSQLEDGRDRRAQMHADALDAKQTQRALGPMQAKAAGYASQLVQANNAFQANGGGTEGSSSFSNFFANHLPNAVVPDSRLKAENAKRQWAISSLRPEAGRPPTEEQINSQINTYFPTGGEGASVRAQKQQARAQATQRLLIEAGPQGMEALQGVAGGPAAMGTNMVNFSDPNAQLNLGASKYMKAPGTN
jgi:hypothetical protein